MLNYFKGKNGKKLKALLWFSSARSISIWNMSNVIILKVKMNTFKRLWIASKLFHGL